MGTCCRIVDPKNKLYYEMDKWYVGNDDLVSVEALTKRLVDDPIADEEDAWRVNMGRAIVATVSKYMTFPLESHTDGGDVYFDIEEQGYVCCGDRFSSGCNVNTPYDPKPPAPGEYFTWHDEWFAASGPAPVKRLWNGTHWCDARGWRLTVDTPVWWASLDNEVAIERTKK
jgi:hypothetical protein